MKQIKPRIKIVTVCGVGMGSSLILKMTVEDALREAGIDAVVEHSDLSGVKSMNVDVIVAQSLHAEEVKGLAPVVIIIKSFLDKDFVRDEALRSFREQGWISD